MATCLLAVALAGMWAIESHAFRDGRNPVQHSQWPAELTLQHGTSKFQCLLIVHPHCPCSRAALAAVKQHLLEASAVDEDWQIVFVQPQQVATDWHVGFNWQRAQEIPGVECVLDPDGRNAQVLGAVASGHCFIFDSLGRKLFDGGLTAGRGMEGICLGQKFLASLHGSLPLETCTAPVYGCRLLRGNE